MSDTAASRRRGGPLAMLALLIGVWIAGRAVLWENPFPLLDLPASEMLFAEGADRGADGDAGAETALAIRESADPSYAELAAAELAVAELAVAGLSSPVLMPIPGSQWAGYSGHGQSPAIAAGHQYLMNAALGMDWHSDGLGAVFGPRQSGMGLGATRTSAVPPFVAQPGPARAGESDRWSLDTSVFYRAGSGSLSTSLGRVPVYGASQAAANLQYRIAPASRRDPRAYLRAYHALVRDGETELAAGLSARPLAAVPLRLAGELRATRNPTGTDYRPAGYAVTELPPQRLPLGFSLEVYGAAGYVGGDAATYFAEGQTALTREFVSFKGIDDQRMRLSLGGAAWGGAQEDASRVDAGPTMRLDLKIGEVPARISLDWREQLAGDAAPNSGIAATVSTRF